MDHLAEEFETVDQEGAQKLHKKLEDIINDDRKAKVSYFFKSIIKIILSSSHNTLLMIRLYIYLILTSFTLKKLTNINKKIFTERLRPIKNSITWLLPQMSVFLEVR